MVFSDFTKIFLANEPSVAGFLALWGVIDIEAHLTERGNRNDRRYRRKKRGRLGLSIYWWEAQNAVMALPNRGVHVELCTLLGLSVPEM